MKRKEAPSIYKWSETAIYKNVSVAEENLKLLKTFADQIATLQNQLSNINNFKKLIALSYQFKKHLSQLMQFSQLSDLDQTNNKYRDFRMKLETMINTCSTKLSFIEPELKKIGSSQIITWIENNSTLHAYRYHYHKFFRLSKHILNYKLEHLLNVVDRSRSGYSDLYDTLSYADRDKVMIKYKDKLVELTPSLHQQIMEESDPLHDQTLRFHTNYKRNTYLRKRKASFSKIYEMIIISNLEEVDLRHYSNFLDAALTKDNISSKFYNNLLEFGKSKSHVRSRFHKLNRAYLKQKFGLKKFYATDSNLSVGKTSKTTYTVEDAKTLIRSALQVLGTDYLKNVEKAWRNHQIDYYSSINKRKGAYSSGGTIKNLDPIILMNWDDSFTSVRTLIHEVGHSVHTFFANDHQPFPLNNYPIIQAEVASTLNEHLLFDYMIQKIDDQQLKMRFIHERIQDIIGSFYRQLHFADFEKRAHDLVAKHNPLNDQILDQLFQKINLEYGNIKYDQFPHKKNKYIWPMVLHFFHAPFYVYKYATSIVASFYFFQEIKKGNINNYLSFLKAGGSNEPLLIFQQHGINFEQWDLYQVLVNYLTTLIDQLEVLYQTDVK